MGAQRSYLGSWTNKVGLSEVPTAATCGQWARWRRAQRILGHPVRHITPFNAQDFRDANDAAVSAVDVPDSVIDLLVDLRNWLQVQGAWRGRGCGANRAGTSLGPGRTQGQAADWSMAPWRSPPAVEENYVAGVGCSRALLPAPRRLVGQGCSQL